MGKKSRRINDDEDVDEVDEAEGGGKKKKGRKGGKKAKEAKGKGKGKAKDRDWEVVERACLPSVKVRWLRGPFKDQHDEQSADGSHARDSRRHRSEGTRRQDDRHLQLHLVPLHRRQLPAREGLPYRSLPRRGSRISALNV